MERKAVYLYLEDESFAKTNRTDEDEIDAVHRRRRRRAKSPLARVRLSSRSSRLRINASRPFAGWNGQWRHAEPRSEVRRRASRGIPRARRRLHLLHPRGDARVCVWPDASSPSDGRRGGGSGGRATSHRAGTLTVGTLAPSACILRCSRDPRPVGGGSPGARSRRRGSDRARIRIPRRRGSSGRVPRQVWVAPRSRSRVRARRRRRGRWRRRRGRRGERPDVPVVSRPVTNPGDGRANPGRAPGTTARVATQTRPPREPPRDHRDSARANAPPSPREPPSVPSIPSIPSTPSPPRPPRPRIPPPGRRL